MTPPAPPGEISKNDRYRLIVLSYQHLDLAAALEEALPLRQGSQFHGWPYSTARPSQGAFVPYLRTV